MQIEFTAKLWLYPGDTPWHFVTVPKKYAKDIKLVANQHKKGFGSVRVEARIGNSVWATSVFPDSESGSYVLPIKKDIRQLHHLVAGKPVKLTLKLLA